MGQLACLKYDQRKLCIVNQVAAKWRTLALVGLKLDHSVVEMIACDNTRVQDRCTEVFSKWLNGEGCKPVSWETLVEALKDIEKSELASEVESALKRI